mgnify:CR=1 FL=1
MKPIFNILIKAALILFLLVCTFLFLPIRSNTVNHFILSSLDYKIAKAVEFENSKIWLPGNIFLGGISASDKGSVLVQAETVNINYNLAAMLSEKKEIVFSAKRVKFYKDIALLNSVSNILTMPKMPNIGFSAIDGDFEIHKDAVVVRKLVASNADMVINGEGSIKKNGDLDCTIHFSFGKPITDTIPDFVKITLLSEEKDGWMGITLKTTGNYAKPSLHVDSELFKLNIKETIIKIK